MRHPALDNFGKILMTNVRDEAITDWRMIVEGTMRGERARQIRERLESLDSEAKAVLLSLVPEITDTVLHHFLWTAEQTEEFMIAVRTDAEVVPNLRDLSDGLPGELYTDDGWISRFSSQV